MHIACRIIFAKGNDHGPHPQYNRNGVWYGGIVYRLFTPLLGMLLAIMLGGQATAHVLEPIAAISPLEAASTGHTAGDADEIPADGDKGYPHHHAACHDHGLGVPATLESLSYRLPVVQAPRTHICAVLATAKPGSPLRPPRA